MSTLPPLGHIELCPFCGNAPYVSRDRNRGGTIVGYIKCLSPGCAIYPRADGVTFEQAQAIWNRRDGVQRRAAQ